MSFKDVSIMLTYRCRWPHKINLQEKIDLFTLKIHILYIFTEAQFWFAYIVNCLGFLIIINNVYHSLTGAIIL